MGVEGMGQGGAAGPGGSAAMSGAPPNISASNLMMPAGGVPNAGINMAPGNPMMPPQQGPMGNMPAAQQSGLGMDPMTLMMLGLR